MDVKFFLCSETKNIFQKDKQSNFDGKSVGALNSLPQNANF